MTTSPRSPFIRKPSRNNNFHHLPCLRNISRGTGSRRQISHHQTLCRQAFHYPPFHLQMSPSRLSVVRYHLGKSSLAKYSRSPTSHDRSSRRSRASHKRVSLLQTCRKKSSRMDSSLTKSIRKTTTLLKVQQVIRDHPHHRQIMFIPPSQTMALDSRTSLHLLRSHLILKRNPASKRNQLS